MKKILTYIILIGLVSTILFFNRTTLSNKISERKDRIEQNLEIKNFTKCVNKDEFMIVLNTSIDKDDMVVYINYSFLQTEPENSLQFDSSFENLFNCSLELENWKNIFVNRVQFLETYTIDDENVHLVGWVVYDVDFPRIVVEELANKKDIKNEIPKYSFERKIGFYDLKSSNIYFGITNPNGNMELAIKRYVEFQQENHE